MDERAEQALIVERNKQFSVVCYSRAAEDCSENGGWCDSEEEAREWVEDKCWIFTGEGWMCINCNAHHMRNLKLHRRDVLEKRKTIKVTTDSTTIS